MSGAMLRRDFLGYSAPLAARSVAPGVSPAVYEWYEEDNNLTRGPEGIYTTPSNDPGFGWQLEPVV